MIDSRGEKINMVLNTGALAPQGRRRSGPPQAHHRHQTAGYGVKGDVGTYQIRPVEEADIAFARGAASTLVRWAWPG
ncbi:MAG: hypothetical protein ACLRMJ_03680 [Alistipes finegoldii]